MASSDLGEQRCESFDKWSCVHEFSGVELRISKILILWGSYRIAQIDPNISQKLWVASPAYHQTIFHSMTVFLASSASDQPKAVVSPMQLKISKHSQSPCCVESIIVWSTQIQNSSAFYNCLLSDSCAYNLIGYHGRILIPEWLHVHKRGEDWNHDWEYPCWCQVEEF